MPEASLEVGLKSSAYKAGLRQLESETIASGQRMGSSLSKSLSSGMMAGGKALGGSIRSALGPALELGGFGAAVGFGALANDAIKAERQIRNLAFSMKRASGGTVDFTRIQAAAHAVTKRWGQSSEELVGAMDSVFHETGNSKLALDSLDAIATTARATGMTVQQTASIAGTLGEQFGIGAQDMGDALAVVWESAQQGGASLEDIEGSLGKMGKAAKIAGVQGVSGMRQMLALVNTLEDSTGSGAAAADVLTGALSKLDAGKSTRKKLTAMGIKTTDKSGKELGGLDVLERVLEKTGGAASELGKIFSADTAQSLALGLGGEKFGDAMKASGGMTGADMQQQAAQAMASPSAKIEQAMNEMKDKIASPEVLGAISKFSELLPKAADGLSKLIDVVGDHPLAAGGAIGAVKLGGPLAQAISSALKGKAGEIGSALGQAGCGCGPGGGRDNFRNATEAMNYVNFGNINGPPGPAPPKPGFFGAENVANAVSAAPAIAAGAATAYVAGTQLIDQLFKDKSNAENARMGEEIDARNYLGLSRTGTEAGKQAALPEMRAKMSRLNELIELGELQSGGTVLDNSGTPADRAAREAANKDRKARQYALEEKYFGSAGGGTVANRADLMQQRDMLDQAMRNTLLSDPSQVGAGSEGLGGYSGVNVEDGHFAGPKKRRHRSANEMLESVFGAGTAPAAPTETKPAAAGSPALQQLTQEMAGMTRAISGVLTTRIANSSEIAAAIKAGDPGYTPH